MRNILTIVLMTGMLAVGLGSARQTGQAEVELQAAIRMETVEGNMKGAIEAYKKLADGADRAIAAKALVRLGQCYEKLGDAEAGKAYERVVRDFADQKEAVEKARALLAAISREGKTESGIVIEQKWMLPAGGPTEMRTLSPSGRYIPYTNMMRTNLYLYDLKTGEDRLVLKSQNGSAFFGPPEISPDDKRMVYTRFARSETVYGGRDFELVIAGIDGSGPTVLMSDEEKFIQPRAFSPDGRYILLSRPDGTDASGAERISLSLLFIADRSMRTLTAQSDYGSLGFSPDGRYLAAYRISTYGGPLPGPLKLVPTDGSQEVLLFESTAKNWSPFWTPDGRNIFFLSDRSGVTDLWSVAVSNGKAEGEPRLRRSDVGPIALLGFTGDGSLYYKSTKNDQGDIYAADLDPATGLVISEPVRFNQSYVGSTGIPAAWSPDGRFFAYTRRAHLAYNKSRIASFIIRTEATGEEREVYPVPADAFNQAFPFPNNIRWFPDGRSLLATDFVAKKGLMFRQVDLETGQVKVLLDLKEGKKSGWSPNISPDGKILFFVEADTEFYRLMRRDLEDGDESELYRMARDVASIDSVSLSTDGRLLAFILSHHDQKAEFLMIISVGGGSPRELLRSETAINHIAWTRDDRHVIMEYYLRGDQSRMVVSISIDGGEPKTSPFATGLTAIHPNGRRIAFYSGKGGNEEVWVFRNLLSQPNK